MLMGLSIAVVALATQAAYASNGQGDLTCNLDDQGSCAQATAASLLQKTRQRNNKIIFTQEPLPQSGDNLYDTTCAGMQALGRCWFLSELGKSCATTCQKQNRSFSFVLPDPDEPVTPQLLGHEPVTKNDAWGAIECYVPSEDRYHTANRNSARHVEDIATWKHENCKLACPCGGFEVDKCSWTAPQACAPEFMWKGIKYSGCATADTEHDRPWCQHNFEHIDKVTKDFGQDWSYCDYSCKGEETALRKEKDPVSPAAAPIVPTTVEEPVLRKEKESVYPAAQAIVPKTRDVCEWIPADSCVEEFDYEGSHYLGCSVSDLGTPWCSNTDQYKGSWNRCIYTCADKAREKVPVYPVPSDVEHCTWQPSPRCVGFSQYKGVEYTGCIEENYPTPWCSTDRVHKDSWETCIRVCRTANGSVAPVPEAPVPRIPEDAVEPCQRHQGEEDDTLGSSVTLGEVGFKSVAETGSASDMKRFVCRVVEGIGCRVTDPSGLMNIVPGCSWHYRKTYEDLESTLSSICRAGGNWVVPQKL